MEHHFKLKRSLGFWEVYLTGVGIILGAGIYALVGKAAGLAGNGVWMAFLFSALLASLTGLSYAELSSIFPKAGAEHVYTRKSFGKRLAFVIGWLVIFSGIMGGTTVALGFEGYFTSLLGFFFQVPQFLAASLAILALSFIIFWGVKQSAVFAVVFTLIEAGGLLFIIAIGIPYWGSVDYLEFPSVQGLFSSAALIFFSFVGFEAIVRLSEETKNPTKTVPKALMAAIATTTVMYMLVAISAVSILSPAELASSASPLADVAGAALGVSASLPLAVVALFSTSNTILLFLLGASRIMYGIARDGFLPKAFARVHPRRRTPHIAILAIAALAVAFLALGDISVVANVTNFTIYITFIVINLGVVALRYKDKRKRPFRIPVNIGRLPVLPVIGALTSAVMLFSLGLDIILYGIVLILAGLAVDRLVNRK